MENNSLFPFLFIRILLIRKHNPTMANIRTFSDLNSGSSNKGDDNQREFFEGGHSSGMVVQGGNMREEMLQAARLNQAPPKSEDDWGSGRQVGAQMEAPKLQQQTKVTIKIYNNGFKIEDGPFRAYEENEQNRHFLECIQRGEIPPELYGRGRNIGVDMVIEHSDYVPKRSFSSSNSLGGPSPAPAPSPSLNTPSVQISQDLVVDESKKKTTIQVRAPGGKKHIFKANTDHTVGHLYHFVERTGQISPPFSISTTMPKKQLTDREQTLEAAGLINAVVMVSK